MPFDDGSQVAEFLEWLASAIAGLGFIVPIAFILLFNLFGKKDKDKQQGQPPARPQRQPQAPASSQPPRPAAPQTAPAFPFGPASWMEMQPEAERPPQRQAPRKREPTHWDSAFDRADSADDGKLVWGSAFDDNDAAREDTGLQWGSAFDNPRERTKWGFDDSKWGSGFAPKTQDSEPKITVG